MGTRRRGRKIALILTGLLCAALLVGCTKGEAVQPYKTGAEPLDSLTFTQEEIETAQGIADSQVDFSFSLAAKLLEQGESEENFVFSPYSIWLPMTVLLNDDSLSGEERQALSRSLGLGEQTVEEINRSVAWMLSELYQLNEEEGSAVASPKEKPIHIANGLFLQKDLKPNEAFLNIFAQYYGGQTFAVDFTSPAAVKEINQWAAKKTNGKIPSILEEVSTETVVALANAIYYTDTWIHSFDEADTEDGTFYTDQGEVTVPFMLRQDDNFHYYENSVLQAVRLPLDFATMTVILPREKSPNVLLSEMDWESYLTGIREKMWEEGAVSGTLLLPRFQLDSGMLQLDDALEKLGVPFFGEHPAYLNGIVEMQQDVRVSEVVQKAMLEVNEKGATAAAVTAIACTPESVPEFESEPFTMVCDRPFIVILSANCGEKEMILFMGIVNNPSV